MTEHNPSQPEDFAPPPPRVARVIEVRQVAALGHRDETVRLSYFHDEDGTSTALVEFVDGATDAELGRMVRGVMTAAAVKW